MATKIWDNRKVLGEVFRTGGTKLVVELVARDGVKYVNIRSWYILKRTGEWRPSREGVSIPVEYPMHSDQGPTTIQPLKDMLKLMQKGLDESADFEIEDEENAVWRE